MSIYNTEKEKKNVVNDAFVVASKAISFQRGRGEFDSQIPWDLTKFALGSDEPKAMIQLLTINQEVYKNEHVKKVVDRFIEENPDSAHGLHLKALREYAIHSKEFYESNQIGLLGAISMKNRGYKNYHRTNQVIEFCKSTRGVNSLQLIRQKEAERDHYLSQAEKASKMLKDSNVENVEKCFIDAERAYDKQQARYKSSHEALICRVQMALIRNQLGFEPMKRQEELIPQLQISSLINPNAEQKFYIIQCKELFGKIDFSQANRAYEKLGSQKLSDSGAFCITRGKVMIFGPVVDDIPQGPDPESM